MAGAFAAAPRSSSVPTETVRAVLCRLRRRYRAHTWTPVTIGLSGASVHRLDGTPALYVKVATSHQHPDSGFDLDAEAQRLVWLRRQGMPTAQIVEYDRDGEVHWLVTTAVSGRAAAEWWPPQQRDVVVDALADIARTLHALNPRNCPFDRSLAVTVPHARYAAYSGLVVHDNLDPQRRGWSPQRLVAELEAAMPASEDLVVCHGDLGLPNVLLDPDTLKVTGLIDVGRLGIADRYADLATVTRSLTSPRNPHFGPVYASRFLDRYGLAQIEQGRIEFYRLLDEFF